MTQQHPTPFWRNALHAIAASALLACAGSAAHAQGPTQPPPSLRPGEPVTLNFTGAEIEAVARAIGAITNRNVVVDPRVKGQITLLTDKPVPPATAYQQFLAALRLQGFTIVESAGLYKVIPEADAKLQSSEVAIGTGRGPSGGQIITQIFKLNYENAANLVPVLRPLISPNNTINVNPGNNSLVITDYADNLQRISRIVATMDVSNATDVEIIPLRHAVAADMVALVSRLIEGGTAGAGAGGAAMAATANIPGQSDNAFKTSLMAEPRSNSVVLRAANPARLAQVRSLIARLDQPAMNGGGDQGNIHVVYLKNADAVALAATLRAAIGAQATAAGSASGMPGASMGSQAGTPTVPVSQPVLSRDSSGTASMGMGSSSSGGLGSSGSGGALGVAQQPSTGGMIQADPSTNSLIITAPPPIYRQLRAVIDKLDGRRAQVLIESLIVELKDNRLAQFGVQWQAILSNNGKVLGSIGNNSSVAGANILSLLNAFNPDGSINTGAITGDTVNSMRGTNLGFTQSVNGNTTLGFLANFLQNSGDANILSTPNLMTLDNEEARIIVGQNVPMVTGSYASNSTGGTVNPFTTVERKDVGLMLRVRPQINENGTVKLAVFQEVSSVDESTRKDSNGLTTNKRSIESNVLVEDGNIVVLGGLIDDNYSQAEDRVPLLGDIPVVGNLFRNTNRKRNKTNLMVFLRPVVMRDAQATNQVSTDRYEAIRAQQQGLQPEQNMLLRSVNAAPVLPTLPPKQNPNSFTSPGNILNVPGAKPGLVDFTRPQPAEPSPQTPPAPGAL